MPVTGISTLTLLPGWVELTTWEALYCLPAAVTVTSTLTLLLGGEEDLHVARDRDGGLPAVAAEGGRDQRRDFGHAFDTQVGDRQQRLLRGRHVAGDAQVFDVRRDVLCLDAQLVDLHLDVERGF